MRKKYFFEVMIECTLIYMSRSMSTGHVEPGLCFNFPCLLRACFVFIHCVPSTQSLQKQVQDLVKENTHLKSLVKTLHPSVGDKIMAECCTKLPDIVAAVANQATSGIHIYI